MFPFCLFRGIVDFIVQTFSIFCTNIQSRYTNFESLLETKFLKQAVLVPSNIYLNMFKNILHFRVEFV